MKQNVSKQTFLHISAFANLQYESGWLMIGGNNVYKIWKKRKQKII